MVVIVRITRTCCHQCIIAILCADLKSEIDVKQRVTVPAGAKSAEQASSGEGSKMADSGYIGHQQQSATPTTPTTPTGKNTPTTPTSSGMWGEGGKKRMR